MKLNILMLGCGEAQLPAIQKAIELGLGVYGLDGNGEAKGKEFCDVFEKCDIKTPEAVEEVAVRFNKKYGIDGVFTPAVEVGPSVGRVVDKLGLIGIGENMAFNLTDKRARCGIFGMLNIPQPKWGFRGEGMKFPCVIKPANKCAADGVFLIKNKDELKDKDYDLWQEYIEGWEISTEVLVFENSFIFINADRNYPGKWLPHMVEDGCQLPSKVPQKISRKIEYAIKRIVDAFSLKRCAIKLDLIVKDNIVYVIECAPRLGGGKLSSTMIPMYCGIDWWRIAIKLAMGLPIEKDEVIPKFSKPTCQRYKINENPKSNRDREYSVEFSGDTAEESLNKCEEALK